MRKEDVSAMTKDLCFTRGFMYRAGAGTFESVKGDGGLIYNPYRFTRWDDKQCPLPPYCHPLPHCGY